MTRIMHAARGGSARRGACCPHPAGPARWRSDAAADPAKIEALETAVRTLTAESGTLRGSSRRSGAAARRA